MAAIVKCDCCEKEIWTSETIAYNLLDDIHVVCESCDPPPEKYYMYSEWLKIRGWIQLNGIHVLACDEPDTLDLIPSSSDWVNICKFDKEEEVCGILIQRYEFECVVCGESFEDENDTLINPTCYYCEKSSRVPDTRLAISENQIRLFPVGRF